MWEKACTKGQIVEMGGGCWYRGRSHLARCWRPIGESYQPPPYCLAHCPAPLLFWFATSLLDLPSDVPVFLARDLNGLM